MLPGFTVAMKNAARSLNMTVKKDGKPFFKATYTVAADGKSMTEIGAPTSGGDNPKIVFDRLVDKGDGRIVSRQNPNSLAAI
jgi:hypothetical protein